MANVISDLARWVAAGVADDPPLGGVFTRSAPVVHDRTQAGGWFATTEAQAIEELLAPWAGREVLDVGGGHGYLAGYLIKRGYQLTVIGNSPSADAAMCRKVSDQPCRYLTGSLRALPFPDRSFPVVISTSLVSHRGHWEAFVHELTRVADEAVVFSFPKRRSLNTFYLWLLPFRHGRGFHIAPTSFVLDEQVVRETLRELGFHITGRHANVLLPSGLHQKLGWPRLSMALEAVPYFLGLIDAFGSPVFIRAERDADG